MKVFITGITGFLGEPIVAALQKRGHQVSGFVRYVSTRDAPTIEKMFPGIEICFGDMQDAESIKEALRKTQPEVIINLAAQTSVEYSFAHLREIYAVDFQGLVDLSLAAMQYDPDLKKFIQASSVEVYGNQAELPLREDMMPNPASPYGVAKVAGEYHLNYLHGGFKFPSVIIRSANTYSRTRNKGFVVEHIIHMLLEKQRECKMGAPDSVRDFLYQEDETDFYCRLIEAGDDILGETINTGTNQPVSIRELFKKLEGIIGYSPEKVHWNSFSRRPYEIKSLTMDVGKAKRLLGWEPNTSLDEGLKRTVDYWTSQIPPSS